MLFNFILKILACLFIIYFCYLAYLDFKCREVKRRLVVFAYPLVFFVNLSVNPHIPVVLFSSLILFITLYVTTLFKPGSFGTIDIIFAPLVTVWFNEYAMFYCLALIIVNSLFWGLGLVRRLFSKDNEKLTNPFLVTMLSVFLVFLVIVPSNFGLIFH